MENYHIFSMIRMGFILKKKNNNKRHVQHILLKKMLRERNWTFVLKLGFLHLFSDSILKTLNKCKTKPL